MDMHAHLESGAPAPVLFDSRGKGILFSPAEGGKLGDVVRRGNVYAGMTDAAGVDHGSSIGTTAPICLENVFGSGVILSILWAGMGYHSGTLGAGSLVWCINGVLTEGPIVTSTAIAVVNMKVGSMQASVAPAKGLLHDAATLLATPDVVRPFGNISANLATTALAPWKLEDIVEGAIQLMPGAKASIQGIAGVAGTSPLVQYGIMWEAIPIPGA